MKKMNYESLSCELSVAENYTLLSRVACTYGKDTVAYAVERFLPRCASLCRECTWKSWKARVAKGRAKKKQFFQYLVPAVLMELPGNWVRISGDIDAVGVSVKRVELLREHPWLADDPQERYRMAG